MAYQMPNGCQRLAFHESIRTVDELFLVLRFWISLLQAEADSPVEQLEAEWRSARCIIQELWEFLSRFKY